MASPGGCESQKQLLSLIRDFAVEKSHGERRVSDLRRRLADKRAAAEAAADELGAAKRAREEAERELRGSQVQAAIAAASVQTLEATIARLQEEISKVGSDLDALKSTGDSERDEFIRQMHEMNTKIRQFQQLVSQELAESSHSGLQLAEGHVVSNKGKTVDSEGIMNDLANKVSNMEVEVHLLEGEYKNDQLDHDKAFYHEKHRRGCNFDGQADMQLDDEKHRKGCNFEGQADMQLDDVCQELAEVQAKRALMEAFMGDMKQVQELGGQSAELDKVRASLAEELQRRYTCLGCGVNNMAGLEEIARILELVKEEARVS